jgi:hypothetical protein
MQPPFKPFVKPGIPVRRVAIALLIAIPMGLAWGLPAQANFWQTVRGIFTGDTREGARGNTRGAAIRDRHCSAPMGNSSESGATNLAPDSSIDATERLILLAPNTGQTLTITTVPDVFVYIPPHVPGAEAPSPLSFSEPTANINPTEIDLDDIDSVVDEDIKVKVDQTQQSELLLEFQFDGRTRYYSLPDQALIAKLQIPADTALESGEISQLEVRLVCRRMGLTSLSQTAQTESTYSTESEVFVEVQRVEPSNQLIAAIETYEPGEVYQAYLDNQLWLEMVAALAANPQSEAWVALLEVLEIPAVDSTPHILTPITH